jgi:acetyl-CoA C-acetyltransferase
MGRLFAPFTQVAAGNPHAMSQARYTAEELATVTPQNRLVADPSPPGLVARDQANQGAAVLIASVGKARALGVPEDRWVYLHGGADAKERTPLERNDLRPIRPRRWPAAARWRWRAWTWPTWRLRPLQLLPDRGDQRARRAGDRADDPRPLTVTGGLPFFGGAGNNYSMHAIASMVRRLRAEPGALRLASAQTGGLAMSNVHHAIPAVYSTRDAPTAWTGYDSAALEATGSER